MWMLPHTLTGVAIAVTIDNPAISLPLAFTSHYVLDFIPHWNQYPTFAGPNAKYLYLDFLVSFVLGVFFACRFPLFSPPFWIIILAAALANLPDAIRIPSLLKQNDTKGSSRSGLYYYLERFHDFIDQDVQHEAKDLVWKIAQGHIWFGVMTQVLVCVVSLFFIFRI